MPSSAIALRAEKPLTPAMTAVVWEIAAELDRQRIPSQSRDAVWLDVPTTQLRGEGARADNVWLRECLERLTGIKVSGEHRGDPWGAVILAEWHIAQGGSMTHLLIPPAALAVLRSPGNFAKIEAAAAHTLTGHAQRLYGLLADKKRLGRPSWTFPLDELHALMGVQDRKAYKRFNNFRQGVLEPALKAIAAHGTVEVRMTPQKLGRAVHAVRFDWRWKDPRAAAELAAEVEPEAPQVAEATPAPAEPEREPEPDPTVVMAWWDGLGERDRQAWSGQVGRTFDTAAGPVPRRERDIAADAWKRNRRALHS